ncbi:hypothetical protein GF406_23325 [candidate division KSB1 bacterium]|nr:hypothetical protein [candidate division KSB1 bacterium]
MTKTVILFMLVLPFRLSAGELGGYIAGFHDYTTALGVGMQVGSRVIGLDFRFRLEYFGQKQSEVDMVTNIQTWNPRSMLNGLVEYCYAFNLNATNKLYAVWGFGYSRLQEEHTRVRYNFETDTRSASAKTSIETGPMVSFGGGWRTALSETMHLLIETRLDHPRDYSSHLKILIGVTRSF